MKELVVLDVTQIPSHGIKTYTLDSTRDYIYRIQNI